MCSTSSSLHLTSWHPLLVRQLHTSIRELETKPEKKRSSSSTNFKLSTVFAILARIDVPLSSTDDILLVLPCLRDYILSVPIEQVLNSSTYLDNSLSWGDWIVPKVETLKDSRIHRGTIKRRTRPRRNRKSHSKITYDSDDSDADLLREIKTVQVHERVLMSDSDGFPAVMGDTPSAGTDTCRTSVDDCNLYVMYKYLFGCFPTLITQLDSLLFALNVYTKFAARYSIENAIGFLSEYIESNTNSDEVNQAAYTYPANGWKTWQLLSRQCSFCVAAMAALTPSLIGISWEECMEKAIHLVLSQFKWNITGSLCWNAYMNSEGIEEMCLANVDDTIKFNNIIGLQFLETLISLLNMLPNADLLAALGCRIVEWSQEGTFSSLIDSILRKVDVGFHVSRQANEAQARFVFELFAALVDKSEITEVMLQWVYRQPCGFRRTVKGVEILATVTPHISSYPGLVAEVLRRHISVVHWSFASRTNSFTMRLLPGMDSMVCNEVVDLSHTLKKYKNRESLLQILSVVLRYCDPVDTDCLLIENVIPTILEICKLNGFEQVDENNPRIDGAIMTVEMKVLLKLLELLAAYLQTAEAAAEVIKCVIMPYRAFLFTTTEVQDVFVAVCAKSIRLSSMTAITSGLSKWVFERLYCCYEHAKRDIWVFMDNSASMFCKLLLAMLNIVSDVIEDCLDPFKEQVDSLLLTTNKLIDTCFEWMRLPSEDDRSCHRLAQLMCKSMSIHLMLHNNTDDVLKRFSVALLKTLNTTNPPSRLISYVVCSLLDCCVSRFPPSFGNIGSIGTIEQHSEDDALMGEGCPVSSVPPLMVLHPNMVKCVLSMTASILTERSAIDEDLEFLINKVCTRLQIIDFHCTHGTQWLNQMFCVCDALTSLNVASQTLSHLLHLIVIFIKRNPTSEPIGRLLSYYHKFNHYKEAVLCSFNMLICESTIDPVVSLLFPQCASPLGIDVSTDDKKIQKAQKDMEITRRSSSSSLLVSAVERFLSGPKTDVETESERRLEKKKHLRDTVRDSPNLALGPIGGSNMSSPIKFSGDSAASFSLASGTKLSEGISTSFWIKRTVQAKTLSELQPLHLLSIGNDEIVVRCCMNGRGRVTIDVTSGDLQIDRLRIRGFAKELEWTHIVLAVQVNSDSIFIQGTVGYNTSNLEAPLIVKLNSHSFYPTIAFGCSKRRSGHSYYISNIFGFKGLVNESNISVLASLGCQLSSLTETRVPHISQNIASDLNYKSVTARRRSLEAVLNDGEKYIHKLQRSIFFQVRCNSPLMYSITCSRAQDEEHISVEAHPGIASRLQSYQVNWGNIHPFQHLAPSVHNAITALGGIRMIIYLYAKAVNDGLNSSIQYSALSILLQAVRTQSVFYCHDIDSIQIIGMLTRTLASDNAIINEDILELLIEHCISYSETESATQEDTSTKRNDSHMAVVRDSELLVSLACRTDLWRNERFPYWHHLMSKISSVMDPLLCSSTFKFNRAQLIRTNMLQKLLHCILQMIQDSAGFQCRSFTEPFVSHIIFIVESLLESPYNLDSITNLWNFIFLSHPATHTYIDHRVEGHSSWINSEFVREDGESEIIGDSPLCKTFTKYLAVLGRARILELWRSGATPYEIRKAYSDRIQAGDNHALSSEESLPDLLRDVDALLKRESLLDDGSDSSSLDIPHHISEKNRKQGTNDPEWITAVRAGLMNAMATALQNGADSLLACLQHDVISWHAIVVLLSHQPEQRIRDCAVDILQKFLLRSPTYTKITFIRLSGFQMLASQLKNQPVTPAIADHLFSMMCGEVIRLGDGLDQNHLATMLVDSFQCESLYAIFVAFEEAVPDTALFWNITNALIKVFENCSQLRQAMVEEGLADVMVNTLRRIAMLEFVQEHDIFTGKPVGPLQLEAWSLLAQRMLILSIPYHEPRQTAACERFMQLLLVADIQAARDTKWLRDIREQAHKMIRGQLCQLLHTWMESIRIAFSEEGKSASATSSMDSLYKPDDESSTSSPSSDYDFVDDVITSEKAHLLDGTSPVAAFIAGSFSNLREKISNMGPIHRTSLRCPYPRRTTPSPMASFQSLTDRIIFALETDATVFAVLTPTVSVVEEEKMLYHFYLYYLLGCWRKDTAQNRSVASCIWERIMVQCRDRVRVLLAQAVAFILFPARRKMYEASFTTKTDLVTLCNWRSEWVDEKRRQLIRALAQELQNRNALKSLLSVNLDYEYALCLGLYELGFVAPLCSKREDDINAVIRFIGTCKVGWSMDRFTTADQLSSATTDEMLSVHSFGQHKNIILSKLRSRIEVIRDEEEKTIAVVSDMTMAVTREAVEEQNIFRKLYIKITKEGLNEFVSAEKQLLVISRELCHPCSPAYEPHHWPIGWALDPTENPLRERRRLMPYYYPFESRFFMEDRQSSIILNQEESPFSKILVPPELGTPMNVGRSPLECIQIDESIRLVFDITVLRGTMECSGELLITETQMHFVGEKAKSTQKGTACSVIAFSWKFDEIVEIFSRNHLLKDVALEVFTIHGVTNLFVFQTLQKRNHFKSLLRELGFEQLFPNIDHMIQQLVQTWRKGGMTNFEYLMQLNKYAGRSFNDLMQYPIFPFVLSDYTSAVLDLNNQSTFRDLTKPMAIQDKRMEDHYIRYYNCLKAECDRAGGDTGPMHFGPYHYGSHYSNSGIVAHYLVRLSPFTQIALEYQDHSFDIPDRLFNSIESTWRLSSSESTTDFKELIPEFFCLPEFLRNRDSLDLGVRQGGERANHVLLPNWVPNADARLFILIHRQALESPLVTQSLQKWVDLIFGYKQTGKPALDAVNVFHPATYAGHIKEDEIGDEVSQNALRTMVKSYGQMPIQIFTTPTQPHIANREKSGERLRPPGPGGSVVGVRWGEYLGSPEQENELIQPVLSLKAKMSDKLKHVVSFPDGSGAAVPKNTILISTRPIGKISIFKDNCTQPSVLGALSWMFKDSVLRFRSIRPEVGPWINIMSLTNRSIATICFSENNQTLFIAFTTGIITAYRWTMNSQGLISCKRIADLIAHHTAANNIFVCDEFSILVSADSSGKVIEWDINRLSYVREIRKESSVVNCICVSSTSGDIAVVSQQGLSKNIVELYSINGDVLCSLTTEYHVNCIAMTNLSEGTAINCIALGLQGGHVKLVEMWTMTVIRDIFYETVRDGVMSLTFSSNGRRLFVMHSTGRILCWQSVSTIPTRSSLKTAPPFSIINPHDMD